MCPKCKQKGFCELSENWPFEWFMKCGDCGIFKTTSKELDNVKVIINGQQRLL